jgi:rSAM/selenodomain-associated transferase 1
MVAGDGCHLIVFVKAPRPGQVKTRLAQTLGPAAASHIYSRLVDHLCQVLAPLPAVELRFTPDDAGTEIEPWRRSHWRTAPQGEGDLGTRLHHAFAASAAAGHTRTVIIGSDCPTITCDDIESAWDALGHFPLTIGPARDGGYWLIGLRQPALALFTGIAWSTGAVLAETLARAQSSGLGAHLLREQGDIDTATDWEEFLAGQLAQPLADPRFSP